MVLLHPSETCFPALPQGSGFVPCPQTPVEANNEVIFARWSNGKVVERGKEGGKRDEVQRCITTVRDEMGQSRSQLPLLYCGSGAERKHEASHSCSIALQLNLTQHRKTGLKTGRAPVGPLYLTSLPAILKAQSPSPSHPISIAPSPSVDNFIGLEQFCIKTPIFNINIRTRNSLLVMNKNLDLQRLRNNRSIFRTPVGEFVSKVLNTLKRVPTRVP
jgi:hypothetical protein